MDILSAKYDVGLDGETTGIFVTTPDTVDPDGTGNAAVTIFVPISLNNSDYAEIMRQVEAGDLTIQDADD